ncbi:uncharacterized protein LOC110097044 isoform X1 [Dendrobium catenatum]|uniref:Uncharacterized protein n=1 Tax=Dendrobium catenatum TaxID=906689 RepID=A0A2I0XH62_9ASPA|nr:uncharacterized protein LOC110097044 isoform X1 [Dendrobium catenatum]PKU87224.1 hypothetical protein MA16_Dca009372 [Dendrobium catenatum]
MEGKKSFVDELFPRRESAQQAKSDILSSIFPPRSTGGGKDSSHSDFSGTWRKQGEGNSRGSPSKNQSSGKKYSNPLYLCELPESCLMSSSVYYGGRDDFIPESSASNNSSSYFNCKKDKEDDSANTDVATRGDWWQGSLYY